jgi:hypothetical protein
MSGIEGLGRTHDASHAPSFHEMTAKEAFKMLGSLRETVHAAAVRMQHAEPPIPVGHALTNSLIAGLFVTTFCPPVGIGIAALGVATAVLETLVFSGVNIAGDAVAYRTRPPDT